MNICKEIPWGLAFRVWWHVFWRYVVFGMLGGIILGILVGFVGALLKLDIHLVTSLSVFLGAFVIIAIQIWVVRRVLTKDSKVSKYRLALLEE
ncbi:MAG: hypothetical protein HY052_00820 [Proteobacteria bacterium]|nr:hypothetical protein [Pseudomonadota bacterium]